MKVLCNGFNLYNQLRQPEPTLKKLIEVFEEKNIKKLSLSHSFFVLQTDKQIFVFSDKEYKLDVDFKVVDFTSNKDKILLLSDRGKIYKIDLPNFNKITEISNLVASDKERIIKVESGSKLNIAYSNIGTIYNIPNKLNFVNKDVIDVQCGNEHCILLDKNGNVYTFGGGSRGQLGHGSLDESPEPVIVEALSGIKIIKIAAGGWHSCAISCEGDLYSWGWNSNGQLGLQTNEVSETECVSVLATPRVVDVDIVEDRNIVNVACGSRHTVVLLDNNCLYGCGWNKYFQLTGENKDNYYSFTFIRSWLNEEVLDLNCGPWNSVILCK